MNGNVVLPLDEESAALLLRDLYKKRGYAPYRMSKFEEYDFYAANKSYLPSPDILTFTDLTGKLMALKPDVTLSILRGVKNGEERRVYYNEKVYRPDRAGGGFREITQVGLERIGRIDLCACAEVLRLAYNSLRVLSEDCTLVISDMDLLALCLRRITDDEALRRELTTLIAQKNVDGILSVLPAGEKAQKLTALCRICDAPERAIVILKGLFPDGEWQAAVAGFEVLLNALENAQVKVDFSVVQNERYYNGVVFRGYIRGVAERLLSGGRYDRLMEKMGKKQSAIGFAVYLDKILPLLKPVDQEVDCLIVYDEKTDLRKLTALIEELDAQGKSVFTARQGSDVPRAQKVCDLTGGRKI